MRAGGQGSYNFCFVLLSLSITTFHLCSAAPSTGSHQRRSVTNLDYPLIFYEGPGPSPEDGPDLSANALRDPRYLPAQIGGIVGSYAVSLVLVAILLLVISHRRRQILVNGDEIDALVEPTFNPFPGNYASEIPGEYPAEWVEYQKKLQFAQEHDLPASPRSFHRNFSLPSNTSPVSPTSPTRSGYIFPSPTSTVTHLAIGVDLSVDQSVVARDREMAQNQLEDMYKHVMEHQQAKEEGREYEGPPLNSPSTKSLASTTGGSMSGMGILKKGKKPANLNLNQQDDNQSRSSSIFSVLSPRRWKEKERKGPMNISSPVTLTPMTGSFQRQESQEMDSIPPRHYHPMPPPPPVPSNAVPYRRNTQNLPTPEVSPDSTQSIDERIDAALGKDARPRTAPGNSANARRPSAATQEGDSPISDGEREPPSATSARSSNRSSSGLVGLPTSPKPGVNRFPSIASLPSVPSTPRVVDASFASQQIPAVPPTPRLDTGFAGLVPIHTGASSSTSPGGFHRANAPNAVRTGGNLPLRAYEPSLASPSMASQTTKQTVFTRTGPLSPGMATGRTPFTGAPVPYSPYQPFSPVVPITPSLVTREDRKRMKKMVPKTPTVEMVQSSEDLW